MKNLEKYELIANCFGFVFWFVPWFLPVSFLVCFLVFFAIDCLLGSTYAHNLEHGSTVRARSPRCRHVDELVAL